jgi:hypothetical protein
VLKRYVAHQYSDMELFGGFSNETEEVLSTLILERVFSGEQQDYLTWQDAAPEAGRLLWEAKTERIKLSDFAEEFFRRLAQRLGHAMLLKKGELHRLVDYVESQSIATEVRAKLDLLLETFKASSEHEETR